VWLEKVLAVRKERYGSDAFAAADSLLLLGQVGNMQCMVQTQSSADCACFGIAREGVDSHMC
jgi:hypothetical protein